MHDLRSYLKDSLRMLPRPTQWQILRIIQVGAVTAILGMVFILWLRNWYRCDNINSIIVEIHGALIEVLLLSVLFEWYSRKREQLLHASITAALHHRLYDAATDCLQKLDDGYIWGEKRYIYFGEKMAIARTYDLTNYLAGKDPHLVTAMYPQIGDLRRRHLEGAETLRCGIRETYGPLAAFADKELLATILEAEEAATTQVSSLTQASAHESNREITKLIEEVFSESLLVIFWALQLKNLLEKRADRTESREEHSRSMQEKLARMRESLSSKK